MERLPDDPAARFGVIDIGSNTIRLVIFDGRTRSPAYFFNEKATCRLGAAMERTGALDPEGKDKARQTLDRFAAILETLGVEAVEAVATAALREARDGPDFALELRKRTRLPIRVISGPEEGRYAAMGVLMGEARSEGVVADIGGASMELATISRGLIGPATTTALGPLRLSAAGLSPNRMDRAIAETLRAETPRDARAGDPLTLVGGGWRAFATLDMTLRSYPLHVLQGYEMTPEQALETARWAMRAPVEKIEAHGVSRSRAWATPYNARVLAQLIETLQPARLRVSALGLREGVLYERLPAALRASDPLTQSAEVMERISGRCPGLGRELAGWLAPVLPEIPERMRLAACMLSDVNWRIHPDYRAQACFATATQASLGGLTHCERVMLAVALACRYKSARDAVAREPAAAILSEPERRQAEALGRIIRLGAMLSATAPGVLTRHPLQRSDDALTLGVPDPRGGFFSELVEKRLKAAAEALGLAYALRAA